MRVIFCIVIVPQWYDYVEKLENVDFEKKIKYSYLGLGIFMYSTDLVKYFN